eukprot:9478495-Pyramimonas_sp.AAC.1
MFAAGVRVEFQVGSRRSLDAPTQVPRARALRFPGRIKPPPQRASAVHLRRPCPIGVSRFTSWVLPPGCAWAG